MKFLNNMKITQRLTATLALLLVSFIGVLAIFMYYHYVEHQNDIEIAAYNKFNLDVTELSKDMLEARRSEKDFLLRRNEDYITKHANIMAAVKQDIASLKKDSPTPEFTAEVKAVEEALNTYETAVKHMMNTQVTLGLSENLGLQGEMRKAVHDIEEVVNQTDEIQLLATMLMMRRHEKDFLLRENPKYIDAQKQRLERFNAELRRSSLSDFSKDQIAPLAQTYYNKFLALTEGTFAVNETIEKVRTAVHVTEPILAKLSANSTKFANAAALAGEKQGNFLTILFVVLLLLIALSTIVVFLAVSKSITSPLQYFQDAIKKITEGDLTLRLNRKNPDELGDLGRSFDDLLDEKAATLAAAEDENERLNNSIINLIRALDKIADKDFSVSIPVSEDIIGTVAASLNTLTDETSTVLKHVTNVSGRVVDISNKVNNTSDQVIEAAAEEREQIQHAVKALDESSVEMNRIAEEASKANDIAEETIQSAKRAMSTVQDSVTGINAIRETISETEKRIKRLGERSQEISGIVSLINNIAERTHILALNASMHAASAGEAGRGFAVVADEVQRLAENAKQSTEEISSLVNNIRTETFDTVNAMNAVISQVAEGTKLAEQAGVAMGETENTTTSLVSLVKQIANSATQQAESSNTIRDNANSIEQSSLLTEKSLMEQKQSTEQLTEFSQALSESVSVFKLPQ